MCSDTMYALYIYSVWEILQDVERCSTTHSKENFMERPIGYVKN